MTFKENINRICKEQGTTLTALLRDLGISSSKVTAINNGSLPTEKYLVQFAEALNCSVMDFFVDEEDLKKQPQPEPLELNDDLQDIIRIYNQLDRRQKHEFMAMVYEYESSNLR